MAKRGSSGLSRIIGIDKPVGMSSHDVVNVVRKTYSERRVGHTGTLDPLASGVLTVCIGPATRLNQFLVDHDKTYRMAVELGSATTTDDSEGQIIATGQIKDEFFEPVFARTKIASLVGSHNQIPPAYSAIKVHGQKAYEAARRGKVIDLEPRPIEIYQASLLSIEETLNEQGIKIPIWNVEMHVSKGTYLRSIARDLGNSLGSFAHVKSLRRLTVGSLTLRQCCTLEQLQRDPNSACIDPLQLLKIRYAFISNDSALDNGRSFDKEEVSLNEPIEGDIFGSECCTTSVYPSTQAPYNDELVAFVSHNKVKGLYRFDESVQKYKPSCIFSLGVERGSGL